MNRIILNLLYFTILINPVIIFLLFGKFHWVVICQLLIFALVITVHRFPKFKNLFLFTIFLGSLFLTAEIIVRVKLKKFVPENIYSHRNGYYFNKPNLMQPIVDDEFQSLYITDNQGVRVPYPGFKKRKADWVFFGDSYTQGAQVNYSELYTSRLQEFLPNNSILNLGISGFSLQEHYNIIMDYIKTNKPQKVFLQLCVLNDFLSAQENEYSANEWLVENSDLYRLIWFANNEDDESSKIRGRWILPFSKSLKYNKTYNLLDKNKSKEKREILAYTYQKLSSLSKELKKREIEFIVILIPTKEQVYSAYFNNLINNSKIKKDDINLEFISSYLFKISSTRFKLIDVLKHFRKKKEMLYFERDEHLNKFGHDYLARIIAECKTKI